MSEEREYTVVQSAGENAWVVLSGATTYEAACMAAKTHLLEDGEPGPLQIYAPSGPILSTVTLTEFGVVFRDTGIKG